MGKIRLRRTALPLLVILLALAGLLLAKKVWWPWQEVVMTAAISLSTDEEAPVVLYQAEEVYGKWKDVRPSVTAEIDLEKWAGKLVRVDIEGTVKKQSASGKPCGVVGCSVKLTDGAGARSIEFAGWQNDGSPPFHLGTIGSPAFVIPGEADSSLVYSENGLLWNVFSVPEKASLQFTFSPILARELDRNPTPSIPSAGLRRLPTKKPANPDNKRPPDVFIYLIDALRADHLGCYGYFRPTSPAIDAFASKATLFEEAFTTTTWTRPSVSTLLTGIYHPAHRVVREEGEASKMGEWPTLLTEALHDTGYKTFAVISMGHVTEEFGLAQGIDTMVYENGGTPDWSNPQVDTILAKQDPEQPVYMFVHTLEPHSPYDPKRETRRRFDRGFQGSCDGSADAFRALGQRHPNLSTEDVEHLIDLYDAEISDNDAGFADFLSILRRYGRYDNALIIVIADHGEAFMEHDTIEHGFTLNREEMRIPLIIRFPDRQLAGLRVKARASMIDIFPTVMAQVGINPRLDYPLPGIDLAGLVGKALPRPSRRVYAGVSPLEENELDLITVIDEDGYKRVINMSPKEVAQATEKSVGLWDTKTDLKEQVDLIESLPVRAAYDEQLLAHWLTTQTYWYIGASAEEMPAVKMTDELREQLKALGYLD
ncbi:MAG: sulfatase-like hydrolase/transferase [Armatimonadetes bacterium]|nr:sulfatase-like hydrolase/transferase [Armatimonadota bacterium]NIM24572.1 sulfatase-like hydrolase/transferase [Armatimonadota bacterium]NIM68448.1 sulfatase-like hydrolase/transferase [Armatimonadota bacterium]NIM76834.1 sulfatase-like hydrolase/transferase [Armatimonadota bacterium]NIN06645.1 sulfatase-like hydrolase/transferase [Armatimonadota bacterium]